MDGIAEISSPAEGSTTGLTFSVFGSAACFPRADLKYYKIELLGQGCGMEEGCFVCEGRSEVLRGKLCDIDLTRGNPSGLYQLRLTVIGIDSVDYAIFPNKPKISIKISR